MENTENKDTKTTETTATPETEVKDDANAKALAEKDKEIANLKWEQLKYMFESVIVVDDLDLVTTGKREIRRILASIIGNSDGAECFILEITVVQFGIEDTAHIPLGLALAVI